MKKAWKRGAALFAALLVLLIPVFASANSAEPPCFAVLVYGAPEDLTVSLCLPDGEKAKPIVLEKGERAWETYYRFYNWYLPGSWAQTLPEGSRLAVETGGESFSCPLPVESTGGYNALFTLDLKSRTLEVGGPWYRNILLTALRVLLTLGFEGLIFFLFGYRARRSWIVFFAVNLVTQALLNVVFLTFASSATGGGIAAILLLLYNCGELLVFLAEMAAFAGLLREHRKRRAVLCALTANAVSLLMGALIIVYLPI